MSTLGMPRTVVHLMRHGEVDNPQGVLYGRLPGYHLSELGRQMAELAAQSLAGRDVTLLVASPLERAQETAAPLSAALGLPVVSDPRVIEAGNRFEGQRFGHGAASPLNPRTWPYLANPLRPSWGEPYLRVAARMMAAVDSAHRRALGHEAVIVSHQLPVWTVRREVEGKRLWHDPRMRQCSLASLTSLIYDGDMIVEVDYTEPAAALLLAASTIAGA